jgi:competence protein ComEA
MKYLPMAAALAVVLFASAAVGGPVNINAADAATLAGELKGVGPAKAAAIIEYRQKHGPFHNVDELALVKGIGQKFIDKNRADLRLGAVAPSGRAPAPGAATTAVAPPRKR